MRPHPQSSGRCSVAGPPNGEEPMLVVRGMFPRRILLSGGGIRSICQVGALKELDSLGHLKNVKEWAGVSAGGFLAMCMTVGYTVAELYQVSMNFDFTSVIDIDTAPGWLFNMGLDSGENIQRLIEACLHVKGLDSSLTFGECLSKCKKSLCIFVSEFHSGEMKIFSSEQTPDYSVVRAIRATTAVPFYFQPVENPEDGTVYMDGAIISNYPMYLFPENERRKTIGIMVRDSGIRRENELNIKTMIMRPIELIMNTRMDYEIKQNMDNTIIICVNGNNDSENGIHVLDFDINREKKEILMKNGKDAVQSFIKSKSMNFRPVRRYSVS